MQEEALVPPVRYLSYADCVRMLDELRGAIGDHGEMWTSLRAARGRTRGRIARLVDRLQGNEALSFEQTFEQLRRRVDPARPYFIGALASGVRFLGDARDYPAALHAVDPTFNSILIDALRQEASRRDGNYVDVGTNLGVVAVSVAKAIGPSRRVVAFEPSPETLKVAAATIALNQAENVTLVHAAASDNDGSITFHATPGNSAIASARKHGFALLNDWREITVPAVRLDTLAAEGVLGRVALVKVDVEGHEMSVLRGALDLIRKDAPTVVYEYTPAAAADHGWTQRDSIETLERAGRFVFQALSERTGSMFSFPLPESCQDQVNVFAVPG